MRKLLLTFIATFCISLAFAGPFGIEMGMTLAQVRAVSKTTPEPIGDNKYYITPVKTNDMFEKYIVQIDPEYGVYWFKAIGKDIYTNGHGERLIAEFNLLVSSIRKTYGQELYSTDELVEGSIWNDSKDFMFALMQGDRKKNAMWTTLDENSAIIIMSELMSDPLYKERISDYMTRNDSTAFRALVTERALLYKQLPSDISIIGVFVNAISTSKGYVSLEYSFSNAEEVKAKADTVF